MSSNNLSQSKTRKPYFASLSRNALYSTLKSYKQNDTKSKSSKSPSTSISNNVKEKSLYSFLEKVSIEYHSPTSSLGHLVSGTNGGQPLRSRHMETKLAARALMLLGGGCASTTALVKSTSSLTGGMSVIIDDDNHNNHKNNNNSDDYNYLKQKSSLNKKRNNTIIQNYRVHGSLSNNKRKRQKRQQGQKNNDSSNNQNNAWTKEVLIGLNVIWNNYVSKLLLPILVSTNANQNKKNNDNNNNNSNKNMKRRKVCHFQDTTANTTRIRKKEEIASILSCAELIGANVLFRNIHDKHNFTNGSCNDKDINNSNSDKSKHDKKQYYKEGMIVNVTKNTWHIACCPKNSNGIMESNHSHQDSNVNNAKNSKNSTNNNENIESKNNNKKELWYIKIVPKKSFELICVLQLPVDKRDEKMKSNDTTTAATTTLYVNITTS